MRAGTLPFIAEMWSRELPAFECLFVPNININIRQETRDKRQETRDKRQETQRHLLCGEGVRIALDRSPEDADKLLGLALWRGRGDEDGEGRVPKLVGDARIDAAHQEAHERELHVARGDVERSVSLVVLQDVTPCMSSADVWGRTEIKAQSDSKIDD